MNSLRGKLTCWFAASVVVVLGIYVGVTYFHLRHELRNEIRERAHPGEAAWILHGTYSESEVDDIAGELLRLSLFYAIPVTGIAAAIGFLIARRSLATAEEMNSQLQEIKASSLGRRLSLSRADREFLSIERNVNELLRRLEASFSQMREYSAAVAHELRTPLTLLRLKVEESAATMNPEVAEALQEELARLSDYVDQTLLLATAEQGRLKLDMKKIDLRPLLDDLIEGYSRWASQEGRSVDLTAPRAVFLTTDVRYLRQVLHALLTNALKHGQGDVRLEVEQVADRMSCRVANHPREDTKQRAGLGRGLHLARVLAPLLGCELKAGPNSVDYVAELTWHLAEAP